MDNGYEPRQRKKTKVKESIIDHTYRDYSQVEVSSDDEATTVGGDDKKQSRLQPNFPAKLHAIVSNPNYQHIICWQPHGRSWKIVDKHLLSTVICPKHFAHAKFESFNRSVNGWGFKRLLNPGPDCKSYYHECFLRGRPELTKLMQRLVNPGKRLPDKAGEPDFYEISRKYPLPQLPTSAPQDQDVIPTGMSPHAAQRAGQQSRFSFQPSQSGGYPYGYFQPGAYPQMPGQMPGQLPSPASNYGQIPGQPYPPQPQQAYWPNQMQSSQYPPNPYAYGYNPYAQMMGAPQGYEQYPHPSMYGQYPGGYPATPTAYNNPASSGGRPKVPAAAQAQPQQIDEQSQYYPSAGTRLETSGSNEGEETGERKPPARTSVKRSLEDPREGPADAYPSSRPGGPTHPLERSAPHPDAAAISAQEGAYNPAAATRVAQEGAYSAAAAARAAQEEAYNLAAAARGAQEGAYNPAAAARGPQEGAYNPAAAARAAQEAAYNPAAAARAAQEAAYNPAAASRGAQEGAYNPAAASRGTQERPYNSAAGQPRTTDASSAPEKASSEGSSNPTGRRAGPGVKQEEGGDPINEQQLLQDFFQHF